MPRPASKKPQTGRIIVRTGCITCKARRVKCDERKPTCLRCEKAGRNCEGYQSRSTKAVPPASEIRALVPRAGSDTSVASKATFSNTLYCSPASALSEVLFENEQQRRYFNNFCVETSKQLAGYMESTLWDTIIPQICEKEPSIRHMVTAFGALDLTSHSQESTQQTAIDYIAESENHDFALREYHQAIKLLREESSKGDIDLRTAIIACICCVCFEEFHGNQETALGQILTGVNLMHDASNERGRTIEDFVSGSHMLPWIEHELVSAMMLLSSQGMSFSDLRPASYHSEHYKGGQKVIDGMPQTFVDYGEARRYKELLVLRAWHFQHSITSYDFEFHTSQGQRFGWAIFDAIVHPLSQIPPSIIADHRQTLLELAKWKGAFAPLLKHAETRNADFILAATLKIQHLACTIITENALSHLQTSYDTFLDSFSEIVALATALVSHKDHSTKKGCFTFYDQYIIPTYVCALKCRNRPIRHQAMRILLHSPQREGLWDSVLAGRILEWIIELEEQGMDDDGFIPEAARTRAVNAVFDCQMRKALVSCRVPRNDGGLDLRETEIIW